MKGRFDTYQRHGVDCQGNTTDPPRRDLGDICLASGQGGTKSNAVDHLADEEDRGRGSGVDDCHSDDGKDAGDEQ